VGEGVAVVGGAESNNPGVVAVAVAVGAIASVVESRPIVVRGLLGRSPGHRTKLGLSSPHPSVWGSRWNQQGSAEEKFNGTS